MDKERQDRIILYEDLVGRTIMAETIPEQSDDDYVMVKNPVIIDYSPDKTQQKIGITFYPKLIREFFADKQTDIIQKLSRRNISVYQQSILSLPLYSQYENITSSMPIGGGQMPQTAPTAPANAQPAKVINLFDN